MTETEKIKFALERSIKALKLKPSLGLGTGKSTTRIKNGLTCEIQEGSWKFTADMPASIGGNAVGPTPGVYGRAALGSCLAIGYMMVAAMDGARTVDQLWHEVGHQVGEEAPSQDDVIQLLAQLNAADLLQTEVSPDSAALVERAAQAGRGRGASIR